MLTNATRWALTMMLAGAFIGCDTGFDDDGTDPRFASNEAVLLDFTFHGELETNSTWNVERTI